MMNPFKNTRYEEASLSKVNDFSHEQSEKIAEWLKNPKNFLYIHSDPGIGKTYIAAAITNKRFEENKYCWYFNEDSIFKKLDYEEKEGYSASLKLSSMCENEFLIWDDMGATLTHGKNDYEDNAKKNFMFQFVDERYNSMLPTVIISNYSIPEFGRIISKRFESRLEAKENLVIEIFGDNKRLEGL